MSFQIRPKLRTKLPLALVGCVVALAASSAPLRRRSQMS